LNQYEAMFVFDPTFGNTFEKCEAEVRRLLDRAQGEMIHCRKWDERRLAYRIKGRKRGVYVLVYFKAPPQSIAGLERDAQLAESTLRLLVLRADHLTREDMEKSGTSDREAPADRDGAREEDTPAARKRRGDRRAAETPADGQSTERPPDTDVAPAEVTEAPEPAEATVPSTGDAASDSETGENDVAPASDEEPKTV
jgi:small subunit ribosomal protein S6